MIEEIVVTKIFVSDKSKDGKLFKTRDGKPYKKIAIKTDKHSDKWLSMLVFQQEAEVLNLEVGQTVFIKVEENGDFLNFSVPSRVDYIDERLKRVESLLQNKNIDVYEVDVP